MMPPAKIITEPLRVHAVESRERAISSGKREEEPR
jgi:hypothetical protein